jgi:hypothetical protein
VSDISRFVHLFTLRFSFLFLIVVNIIYSQNYINNVNVVQIDRFVVRYFGSDDKVLGS